MTRALALLTVISFAVIPMTSQAQIQHQNSKRPLHMVGPSGAQPAVNQSSKRPTFVPGPRGPQPVTNQNSKRPTP